MCVVASVVIIWMKYAVDSGLVKTHITTVSSYLGDL